MEIRELHYLLYLSIGLLNVPWTTTAAVNIRLADGPHQCAGRVEVLYRDTWGTVCDDLWNMNAGDVACRAMDCGSALEITKLAQFGEGKGQIWLDDLRCNGKESSLADCQRKTYGDNDCSHGEDAGVVCSESVRLVNGTNRCSGRVEVKYNDQWKGVCDSGWGREQAEVVCRQQECGSPITQPLPHFGAGSGSFMYTSSCYGNESSLAACRLETLERVNHTCTDASVMCRYVNMVRLVNGSNRCSGRVEVLHEGRWGSVCDDRWGMEEAEVVCRELDCGTPLAVKYRAYFGHGVGQVWMDDVMCVGHESSLTTCPHRGFGAGDCNHSEDAGVVCSATVRLMNGTDRCSGLVEVYYADHWGTIGNSDWTTREATLVCEELDCGKPASLPVRSQPGDATALRGYTTGCIGIETSITQCLIQVQTTRVGDVSLNCSGDPHVRLVNGTATERCSGRVEVMYDGQWGTVCDDQWDIKDVEVLCRVLDCGSARKALSGAYFGPGTGPVWWSNVYCTGNETSLAHCRRQQYGENSCSHRRDAGLICSSNLRLIGGANQCSGRVQVYKSDHWSPVYQQNWGPAEATVVCREMDCGDAVTAQTPSGSAQGSGGPGYTAICRGPERSIAECSLIWRQFRAGVGEATVSCSGNLKLVNGSGRCAGRVEFFNEGQWGTVCSHSWDLNDAHVVCRQLNCGVAHAVGHFGPGSGRVLIDRLHCNGGEASLNLCMQGGNGGGCNQTSAAGVICTESVDARLVGGSEKCAGRVEVRHAGEWGTVCDQGWSLAKANVVCKLLECGVAVATGGGQGGQGTGPVRDASDSCFSSETSLQQCSKMGFNLTSCGHERDASVDCAEKLRLVNGKRNCSGRVEIFHSGQWGTVCDDDWVLRNAEVVCRQLHCGGAISAPTNAHFGSGRGPIWLDNVNCQGQESAITLCSHSRFGSNDCSHGEDAGVVCYGSLEKTHISLSPASEVNLGDTVEFTCTITQDFGGTFALEKTDGHLRMEKYSDAGAATFVIPKVNFENKGSYNCLYSQRSASRTMSFPHGDPVQLSVILEQPSISLTSHHTVVVLSPNKYRINGGDGFSITCSTHCSYSESFFDLTKSNINITVRKPITSQNGVCTANFEYVADSNVQGEYSCVYSITISTQTDTSPPSKTLTVTVPASASVVGGVLGGLFVLLLVLAAGFLVWRRRQLIGPAISDAISDAMVMFNNVVGRGATDTNNGVLDDRYYFAPDHGDGSGGGPEKEKDTEKSAVEGTTEEDLNGRASRDHEPLINI